MEESTPKPESVTEKLTKMVETWYSRDSRHGAILLQETKDYIAALASIGYTEEEIIGELFENGNLSDQAE